MNNSIYKIAVCDDSQSDIDYITILKWEGCLTTPCYRWEGTCFPQVIKYHSFSRYSSTFIYSMPLSICCDFPR